MNREDIREVRNLLEEACDVLEGAEHVQPSQELSKLIVSLYDSLDALQAIARKYSKAERVNDKVEDINDSH